MLRAIDRCDVYNAQRPMGRCSTCDWTFPRLLVFRYSERVSCRPLSTRLEIRCPKRLFLTALPLGVISGLCALNLNIPRYFVEGDLSKHDLGIFQLWLP